MDDVQPKFLQESFPNAVEGESKDFRMILY